MGTSASSKGPYGGVPMVPPWVPNSVSPPSQPDGGGAAPADGDGQSGSYPSANPNAPTSPPTQASPMAPAGRFNAARRSLGKFASDGDKREMRRGVRQYIRQGYGGKATAVKRFGGTVATAGTLYGALSSVAGGQAAAPGSPLDPALLAGKSAREVMDAVVEAVRPADGTQDAEASRLAIKDALSEVLTLFPDADLLDLTEEQRALAIEKFVALDVYQRAALDIGKKIQERAPTAVIALTRLKDVKDYIKQTVAASFKKLRTSGNTVNTKSVKQVVSSALHATFEVFEEWVK